jgi:hypothetical protein
VDVVLLGDLDDNFVLAEVGAFSATEGGVGLGDDVVLLEPLDELVLGNLNRQLDLVFALSAWKAFSAGRLTADRLDAGVFQEFLGAVNVEVGDTDGLGEALVNELSRKSAGRAHVRRVWWRRSWKSTTYRLHRAPGGEDVVRELDVELDFAVVGLDNVVPAGELTRRNVNLEVDLEHVSGPKVYSDATHVPVHEVQVKVVGTELLERVLNGELDVLGVMVDLEQL